MGVDRNQGQNEAEEAKTKADQGGTEMRQGRAEGQSQDHYQSKGSHSSLELQYVLRHRLCQIIIIKQMTKRVLCYAKKTTRMISKALGVLSAVPLPLGYVGQRPQG
jgi:hypothetical protein